VASYAPIVLGILGGFVAGAFTVTMLDTASDPMPSYDAGADTSFTYYTDPGIECLRREQHVAEERLWATQEHIVNLEIQLDVLSGEYRRRFTTDAGRD